MLHVPSYHISAQLLLPCKKLLPIDFSDKYGVVRTAALNLDDILGNYCEQELDFVVERRHFGLK